MITCPFCHISPDTVRNATPSEPTQPGSLFLCGHCGGLSEFPSSSKEPLAPISKEDFDSLPPKTKSDLTFAIRDILAKSKVTLKGPIALLDWIMTQAAVPIGSNTPPPSA